MKNLLVIALVNLSLAFTACNSDSKKAAAPAAATADASVSDGRDVAQHCMNKEMTLCFLQVTEGGKSSFYGEDKNYQALMLNTSVANANLPIEKVSQEKYDGLVARHLAPKVVYTNKVDIYPDPKEDSANLRLNFLKKKPFFKRHGGKIGIGALILMLLGGGSGEATNSRAIDVSFHVGTEVLPGTVDAE